MRDLRQYLRTETREAHERTETAFAPFRLTDLAGYRAFLTAQASAILPLEAALAPFGAAQFPDWAQRCRGEALRADLAALGAPVPEGLKAPSYASDAERFGAVYVLEGSHMGAKVMLKRVLSQGDPASHAATRFLRHGQGQALWQGFLARLAEAEPGLSAADAAKGALRTFAFFEAAASQTPAPSQEIA